MRHLKQFNVRLKHADGQLGMPEAAPFASIIVAAAGRQVPPALLGQLAVGGRMVLPIGTTEQYLSSLNGLRRVLSKPGLIPFALSHSLQERND